MDWKAVYGNFSDLPKSEQHSLFQAIKDTLFPEPKEDIANMVGEIREVRFSNGLACVHCGSVNNKRNGKYRSRQRYICKGCGKSFNDMTESPISGTHYPHKWLKYFQMMVDGVTLPKIAEELERCFEKEVVLCTDSATNYKAFAKQKGIPHEMINASKGIHVKKGVFHIKHVNSYHQRLKKWMERFNGVATKYMDNYLSWFRFLELHKQLNKNLRKRNMVLESCKKANFMTVGMFKTG
ncbi:ISXO2-like transposase domain-containing protein [Paenibacillus sp. cl6col]|uniref:IS1595 family transposase n=1 Tax=Paenibacillus sp. cl6col TaxID=1761878 RepID=UPI00088038ED|nr:IS1595 family transposase [Paenibacillus sp. cl6col]SDG46009.1 ISXO2-like transposase domain-containing protein [Paenibacillus sp. cl6col]